MNHEPECFYDGERDDDAWQDAEDQPCICDELQAAYQRGRDYERKMIGLDRLSDLAHSDEELEAAYRRGREDASNAIFQIDNWFVCEDQHDHVRTSDAGAAALGREIK